MDIIQSPPSLVCDEPEETHVAHCRQSYLDKVWGGVESAHVAHLGMALGASVVIGLLCGVVDVEAGLTEGTTCVGFRGGVVVRLLLW